MRLSQNLQYKPAQIGSVAIPVRLLGQFCLKNIYILSVHFVRVGADIEMKLHIVRSGLRIPARRKCYVLCHNIQTRSGDRSTSFLMGNRVKRSRCEVTNHPHPVPNLRLFRGAIRLLLYTFMA